MYEADVSFTLMLVKMFLDEPKDEVGCAVACGQAVHDGQV